MRILSVAHALPSRLVTNHELIDQALDRCRDSLSSELRADLQVALSALFERVGAETRYHRAAGDRAIDFGIAAAREALDRADLSPSDVDLLIYAGVGRGFLEPATANVFHESLGLVNATCFDILDACAGWLRAIDVAAHMLRGGVYRNALIVNCEFNFQEYFPRLDSLDRFRELWAGFTIGEAATATVIGATDGQENYYATFRNPGRGTDLCQIPLPHASQYLNGSFREQWRPMEFYAQSNRLNGIAINVLEQQYRSDRRLCGAEYDIIFGHSAGVPATRQVVSRLGLNFRKHYEIFPRYGNTVSASLPLAMSLALDEQLLARGDSILFVAGSAGVTTALCLLEF